jgi:hypothetical protein
MASQPTANAQPTNGSGLPQIQQETFRDEVGEVKDRLDVISQLLEESQQGRIIQLYIMV